MKRRKQTIGWLAGGVLAALGASMSQEAEALKAEV